MVKVTSGDKVPDGEIGINTLHMLSHILAGSQPYYFRPLPLQKNKI
jgi:hypothetical protein